MRSNTAIHDRAYTQYIIDRYRRAVEHGLDTKLEVKELASSFGISEEAVLARLYRAGVIGQQKPMYRTEEEIAIAYSHYGSMCKVADELGVSFYTVRSVLNRRKNAKSQF